jgi:hypothetical protein
MRLLRLGTRTLRATGKVWVRGRTRQCSAEAIRPSPPERRYEHTACTLNETVGLSLNRMRLADGWPGQHGRISSFLATAVLETSWGPVFPPVVVLHAMLVHQCLCEARPSHLSTPIYRRFALLWYLTANITTQEPSLWEFYLNLSISSSKARS